MSTSKEVKDALDRGEDLTEIVQKRRRARMLYVDSLSPEIRECIHIYGLHVVNTLLELGIRNPKHIRHIVETILDEFSPTRGTGSSQGTVAAKGLKE